MKEREREIIYNCVICICIKKIIVDVDIFAAFIIMIS